MDNEVKKLKRNNYKNILDVEITPKQRRVAIAALESESVKEAAERAGVREVSVNRAVLVPGVGALKVSQLLSREASMRRILAFCEDILSRDAETPLKHSDKIAAARLYAEISGVLEEKKGDTYNIGVLDLRQATTQELELELARTEEMNDSAIDVEVKE